MQRESHTQFADRLISQFAAGQFGTVARWQLREAGVGAAQIRTRLAARHLREIYRGVYLVGAVMPAHAHEMAALLALRLKAVLSHRSAAALWELSPYPASAPVWLTAPPERSAGRPRLRIIRATLSLQDVRQRGPLVLTSPPRTILDLASLADPDAESHLEALERIVAEAHYRRRASERELRAQLQRNPHKRGVPALKAVLDLSGGPKRTRTEGERALLRLLRSQGIDGFDVNARVGGYEVDFYWPKERVVVELDGWDGHSSRPAFERDRLKWAELQARGERVTHVTGRQLRRDPDGVVVRLTAALAATRH